MPVLTFGGLTQLGATQLYSDPTGTCLIGFHGDQAMVWDGPMYVNQLDVSSEFGGYVRSEITAQLIGKPRVLPASQALETIGALNNASIPELLAALNRRMDEREST